TGITALQEFLEAQPRSYRHSVGTLPLAAIRPARESSRGESRPELLDELVASVRATGIIQPLIVRPVTGLPHQFEVVAGERRFQAARRVGLLRVPAIIREFTDQEALAVSLIENIQREELSALDEARTLVRLIAGFGLTHEEVARAIGRSRAAVSNLLRLLELPPAVAAMMDSGKISMGHARALLGVEEPAERERMAKLISDSQWSVRETEVEVRKAARASSSGRSLGKSAEVSELLLGQGLRAHLHQRTDGTGKIVIEFEDSGARDAVLEKLSTIAT
ncbi:MAG: ParB/RepB/Spo0J family partition protein, partial [Proteobacteria bacterium]|nr:ParB/RepB/Spo0J family partition protein [Pseudomonadota bacterium]